MTNLTFPTFEESIQPFVAYGKIASEAAEKAFKVQMDSLKTFTEIGMTNFSEGLKVTDMDSLTAYGEKQKDVFKKASTQFNVDAKKYTDIGTKFFESSKTLAEDSVKSTVEAAKSATKVK